MKKAKILSALSALSAASLLAAGPVLAVGVDVTGNGSSSDNTANVSVQNTTTIFQTNTANINNTVKADANTGENSANRNTGGDTSIKTGDASTSVSLSNSANTNKTSVACCDPITGVVKLSGNGADSNNEVNFNFTNNKDIITENNLRINNYLNVGANTGGNSADENTGGNSSINTGDANIDIKIGNSGNNNTVVIGGVHVTPPAPIVAKPLPGMPAVLGLTTKALPMTGFDVPYNLILGLTTVLIGLGFVIKTKESEIEETLSSLASKLKIG